MIKKILITILTLGILLSPFSFNLRQINLSRAETIISAEVINTNTIWTLASSPYVINAEYLSILAGVTLTIEPGVIVKLNRNSVKVFGELKVEGDQNFPVIFTSVYDDARGGDNSPWLSRLPIAGDWGAIKVQAGGKLNLNYAVVNYGGAEQIYQVKSGGIFKLNSAYAFSFDTGVITVEGGQVNISNSEITNNKIGLIVSEGEATIHNSKIYNNAGGGLLNYCSTQVDAINNWWGDDSGPYHPTLNPQGKGNKVSNNVLFDPWLGKQKKYPVLIVPGILGSYLNKNDNNKTEVWPNIITMFFSGDDSYLNELTMESTGWPILDNPLLLPTDIFREIYNKDYFQGLITELKSNGYQEGVDLFVFPYDWRWFINWSAGEDPFSLIQSLKEKIEQIKSQTGVEKVDLIAHSMGGLVSKYYLKYYGQDSVNKFIDIATPHLGAPSAFKILMYGDNMNIEKLGISLLNSETVKDITQNMPSIYQLLPSQNYFSNLDKDYNFYLADINDLDNNGVKGALNYEQSIKFMKNTGRNDYLLNFNNSLHSALDDYLPKLDGLKTYNIVGCGQPTLGKIYVLNKEKSGKYEYGLRYINGDGTVPLRSAESFLSDELYYVKDTEHAYLSSANGVKQLITAILKDKTESFPLSNYLNLDKTKNNCSFGGKQISFHSPIQLHIYDENNNHLGPNESGDIEIGIEGTQYDIIDDNKFVFLPNGHNYKVVGQSIGSGSFNTRIQLIDNGQYNETIYFNEMPLESDKTKVQLEIFDNQPIYLLKVDQDGDNIFENEFQPSSILDGEIAQDLTKPETSINISGTIGNNDWYVSDVQIELDAQDEKNGSGILKTEYSLDNGQTWQIYQTPIILNKEGEQTIWYQSTDRAGNVEEVKEKNFKIDKKGPIINIFVPIEGQKILHSENLALEYDLKDSLSGIATSTLTILLDDKEISVATTTIDLFNYQLGSHNFKITTKDQASNLSEVEVEFVIITNIDSTITDIKRSYNEGLITKKYLKDYLIRQLEWIEQFEERLGQKQHEIHKKIILIQYQLILIQLKLYQQKGWLNDKGYGIIKGDVEYLINNL